MVLGPFAETKGHRLPGRNPAHSGKNEELDARLHGHDGGLENFVSLQTPQLLTPELDSGLLDFAVREQPNQRLIVKVHHLDAVAPWVTEIASEPRLHLKPVLLSDFLTDFTDLPLVTYHDAEMLRPIRSEFFHLEDGQELMLT